MRNYKQQNILREDLTSKNRLDSMCNHQVIQQEGNIYSSYVDKHNRDLMVITHYTNKNSLCGPKKGS